MAFSAGVVGALGVARHLRRTCVPVGGLIAIDGWGVPLTEPFPIHRLSHDAFTHDTSLLLGPDGGEHFYADPDVEHLELWRSPRQAQGWIVTGRSRQRSTAAAFLLTTLGHYGISVR